MTRRALAVLVAAAALGGAHARPDPGSSPPSMSGQAASSSRVHARAVPAATPGPISAPASVPPRESELCGTLDEFARRDRAAGLSEMELAALREERGKALARSVPHGAFKEWRGTLEQVESGFGGKAALRVKLPCRGALATWGGFASDLLDKTRIPQDSELFASLSRMRPGAQVTVSGRFLPSREDGFREASANEQKSMSDPEFIVHFESVAQASDP